GVLQAHVGERIVQPGPPGAEPHDHLPVAPHRRPMRADLGPRERHHHDDRDAPANESERKWGHMSHNGASDHPVERPEKRREAEKKIRGGVERARTAGHRSGRLPQRFRMTAESPWAPLRAPTFRMLWIVWATANVCLWMNDVPPAWLMTTLASSPVLIALVATASSLPVFLLGIPSGALAD